MGKKLAKDEESGDDEEKDEEEKEAKEEDEEKKVMRAQAFQNKEQLGMMSGRKTLEINPNHQFGQVLGPHAGEPREHLLHVRRKHGSDAEGPLSADLQEEGLGGLDVGRPLGRTMPSEVG